MRPRDAARTALIAAVAAIAACHAVVEPTVASGHSTGLADRPLSRADCVKLATDFGPARAGWQARYLAAAAELRSAGLLQNPQLLAEWEDFRLGSVPASALQMTFSLTTAIGDLLARSRREEIAQAELEATLADLATERRQLALQVCRDYDDVLASKELARIALAEVTACTRHRDALRRLADAGEIAPLRAATADAELASATAAASDAANDAEAKTLAFAFALGFGRPVSLQLGDALEPPAASEPADLEVLLGRAAASRPELSAAKARYRAELGRLRLEASPLRFVPVLGAGYRRTNASDRGVGSLEVALPIFDAGGADVAADDAGLLAAAAAAGAAAHAIAAEVTTALAARDAARGRLLRSKELLEKRQALARAASASFAAGELDYGDCIDPERAVFAAQREFVLAEQSAAAAERAFSIDELLAAMPIEER